MPKTEKKSPKKEPTPEEIKKKRVEFANLAVERAKKFVVLAQEKFGKYIKTIFVMGSVTRMDFVAGSDVDVHVIFDDTMVNQPMTPEFRESIYGQLCELAAKLGKDPHVHVQMATLTEFMDGVRRGDPIVFNFVRNGVPIFDIGFFQPLKKLLFMGAIRPGKETVVQTMEGALEYLNKIRTHWEWSIERMFRAVTSSFNSYLMITGMPPVDVDNMPEVMGGLVKQGVFEEEYLKTIDHIIGIQRALEQGKLGKIEFKQVADDFALTEKFVNRMENEVKDYLGGKKRAEVLKDKISTHPKIFWSGKDGSRGYAWLFEDCIMIAVYEPQHPGVPPQLKAVMKSVIREKSLQTFTKVDPKELFKRLEVTQFKPVITPDLIMMVISKLPKELQVEMEQLGVEYPGHALIDLTQIISSKK